MSNISTGCSEYQALTRRQFLSTSAKVGGILAIAPAWLPRVVMAQNGDSVQDIIVTIYLRGGADGLTLCVPYGDSNYYNKRPSLSIAAPNLSDPNSARDLNGFFGLPPSMAPLLDAYTAGHLLVVHATGSVDPSRSHFDAQKFMEVGKPSDPSIGTGWLGRHLLTVNPVDPNAVLRGTGVGNYGLSKILQGGPKALPIPDLDNYVLTGNSATQTARMAWLNTAYNRVADPLKTNAANTQTTINLLNSINFAGYAPAGGAVYPAGSFGYAIKSSAALIAANIGVEAIHIDIQGWDTHNNQGILVGTMANLMDSLAKGLAAFHADIFSRAINVTVVVMSEFGRIVAQNGNAGTDHGHGNCMMFMGQNIVGGRVLSKQSLNGAAGWPGLATGQLYQNQDLMVTIDHRDLLAEVVAKRLNNSGNLSTIFPGYSPTFQGIAV